MHVCLLENQEVAGKIDFLLRFGKYGCGKSSTKLKISIFLLSRLLEKSWENVFAHTINLIQNYLKLCQKELLLLHDLG